MSDPARGAGRAGGLLFLGVLVFVGLLVLNQTDGLLQAVSIAALVGAALAVVASVVRRR